MVNMKAILTFILFVLFLCNSSIAQDCPQGGIGGISISSQAEMDDFLITYPNCTVIAGDVNIRDTLTFNSDISNLSGLQNITTIDGSLSISFNPNLSNFNGLENLTSIGNFFRISENDNLINLTGLENLNSIGHFFLITKNSSLTSLSGLDNLITIDDYFRIAI